jgi:phage terminase small subunit
MPRTVKKDKNLAPGQPAKPANLSERAGLEWDRIVKELNASNIRVTPAHRETLLLAATIAADMADAWAAIERDGAYIQTKGGLAAHPASKRLDALRRDYIKVLSMLGLRTAVAVPDDSKEETLTDILNG